MGVSLTSRLLIALSLIGLYACQIEEEDPWVQVTCRNSLQKCAIGFKPILEEELASTEPDIQRICTQADELKRCVRRCNDNSAPVRSLYQVLEYICNESRRVEVQEIAQDECFSNLTIFSDIYSNIHQCIEKMIKNSGDITQQYILSTGSADVEAAKCYGIQYIMTCIDSKVAEMCGQKVMSFLNPIIRMILRESVSGQFPQCFD